MGIFLECSHVVENSVFYPYHVGFRAFRDHLVLSFLDHPFIMLKYLTKFIKKGHDSHLVKANEAMS